MWIELKAPAVPRCPTRPTASLECMIIARLHSLHSRVVVLICPIVTTSLAIPGNGRRISARPARCGRYRDPGERYTSDSGLFHLSCVTDDGIELWQRSLYASKVITSAEATRVERRPVTVNEVKPPRSLLMLDWWDQDAPTSGASPIPGSETIMELSGQSRECRKIDSNNTPARSVAVDGRDRKRRTPQARDRPRFRSDGL